jgi:hypothetical protein
VVALLVLLARMLRTHSAELVAQVAPRLAARRLQVVDQQAVP